MLSKDTTEKHTWLQDGERLVRVSDLRTETVGFGRKRTLTITIFEDPMPDQVQAVKLATLDPTRRFQYNMARGILQTMQSIIKKLSHETENH